MKTSFNLFCIGSTLFTTFLLLNASEIKGEQGGAFLKQGEAFSKF